MTGLFVAVGVLFQLDLLWSYAETRPADDGETANAAAPPRAVASPELPLLSQRDAEEPHGALNEAPVDRGQPGVFDWAPLRVLGGQSPCTSTSCRPHGERTPPRSSESMRPSSSRMFCDLTMRPLCPAGTCLVASGVCSCLPGYRGETCDDLIGAGRCLSDVLSVYLASCALPPPAQHHMR